MTENFLTGTKASNKQTKQTYQVKNPLSTWNGLAMNLNIIYFFFDFSQAIYLSDLTDVSPILLYKEEGFVEGLVIDPTKQRLYWTVVTSQTGSGFIARLNIDRGLGSYKRLQTSRNNPRAITLHPSGR